jgi:threonyl-tRNA synthetase
MYDHRRLGRELDLFDTDPLMEEQAYDVVRRAVARGLRAEAAGPGQGSLGARIRAARLVPYQAVIGEREAHGDLAAVRLRDGQRPGAVAVERLLERIGASAETRGAELWAAA